LHARRQNDPVAAGERVCKLLILMDLEASSLRIAGI